MPSQAPSAVSRAVASLLRLADADLSDAELLSSGRHPGNAPALLQLASEHLVGAVLATEHGWPLADARTNLSRIPDKNPLKQALVDVVSATRNSAPPAVSEDGGPPASPDTQRLHTNIHAARAVLKSLAAAFEVDLFGDGVAGKVGPMRPVAVPAPKPAAKPKQPAPVVVPLRPVKQRARVVLPAEPPKPVPAVEPHEVEGRAAIEVKQGSSSMASTPFWALMDRWNIPDQAALDLIGHPGGLTKKGTRPRFKLAGEEAALLRSFQEIDAARGLLGLEPKTWLHQPIKAAPFDGATPADYLSSRRKQGVQDTLRFILQHGLRLSMSNSSRAR